MRTLKDYGYDLDVSTWCRVCFGSFASEDLVSRKRDNGPDLGPVCVHCVGALFLEARDKGQCVQTEYP